MTHTHAHNHGSGGEHGHMAGVVFPCDHQQRLADLEAQLAETQADLAGAHEVQNGLVRDVQALSAQLAEAERQLEAIRDAAMWVEKTAQEWVDSRAWGGEPPPLDVFLASVERLRAALQEGAP